MLIIRMPRIYIRDRLGLILEIVILPITRFAPRRRSDAAPPGDTEELQEGCLCRPPRRLVNTGVPCQPQWDQHMT